jgi:two-component system osmolarity sensor histidine kinase EnvZ
MAVQMAEDQDTVPLIKRFLPRTLLGRSLLIIVSPLVLVQVIATWVFFDRHYDTTTKRLAEGVAGDIAMVIRMMGESATIKRQTRVIRLANTAMALDVTVDPDNQLPEALPGPGWGVLEQKLDAALRKRLPYPFLVDADSLENDVKIEVQFAGSVIRFLVSRKRLFSSTTYIFIMWMVGSSIVLFGVATLFMRNQVRPIRRLAKAADSFGKGRDVPDFRPEGATEVRLAAAAFIDMRERIKRQILQRTVMLAGVSHDLRTPLTRIKLQLAMLGDGPEVANLADDVADMERMVEGYLAFARGEGTEQPEATDLSKLLRELVEQMRREATPIDLHLEQEITMPLRREAMRRCLTNLISNAQRHGRQVAVQAGQHNGTVEIVIDDDGPGIPKAERGEVFKPFYRIDPSRNPETGGTGLGLTIARDVVRGHGGDLTLDAAPAGGLRARLRLPL